MIARMGSTVTNIAIDCANAYQLARFWSDATGHPLDPEDEPGDDETEIMLPGGPALHFNEVPEPKSAKNRLHLCLRPDTSRDAEVERLLSLGASLVADRRKPDGWGWVVLADPEGNEFCILLAESERAALSSQMGR
jgi:predicted enzyme related to lactoylglutathione lyase